jgi:hypothetical protein
VRGAHRRAFYSIIGAVNFDVIDAIPIVAGRPYTVFPPPQDAQGVTPGDAYAGHQSTDSHCDILEKDFGESGTLEFTTIDSTTVAGTLNVTLESGSLSRSFSATVCEASRFDARGSTGCETP